ncbi:MAG: hypothetical protein ACO1TE_12165 [Prosthecobacter sp.]
MTLEDAILEVIRTAPLPLKTAEITKPAKQRAGRLATPKTVATMLATMAQMGVVQGIAAGKAAKPEPLYTTQSLEEAAAALLKQGIQTAKKEQEAAKLKAKLPAGLQAGFEGALAQLVALGDAFVLPGTKRLVYAQKPGPSAFLSAAQRKALQKILDQANSVRSSPATLEGFVAWLDEENTAAVAASPQPKPRPQLDESLLREWYAQDRVRSSTVMIPIPQTYARYEAWALANGIHPDSQVLRNFMEGLYNNGLVLLEPCERPQDLPAHERAMLVPMSLGPPGWSWCWVD